MPLHRPTPSDSGASSGRVFFALFAFCCAAAVSAQEAAPQAQAGATHSEPRRIEYGLGLGLVQGPDYRGSREIRDFVSPFPYFVYRGRVFQADRGGVRGQLLRSQRLELTLSVGANITPDADRNRLRRDLTLGELGSSLEMGPALSINLWQGDADTLALILPVRAVVMVGGDDTGAQGFVAQPHLFYRHSFGRWQASWRGGVNIASRDYHAYYYDIPTAKATADYSAYSAAGGYSGASHNLALSRSFNDLRLAMYLRYDDLRGATFVDSPLVETEHATRGGLALMWTWR